MKILEINEDGFKHRDCTYDGFNIVTENSVYRFGINNEQSCCEDWGYITSLDNVQDFSGAELIDIRVVDEAYNSESLKLDQDEYTDVVFINVETRRGTFQMTLYNQHNGYYAHRVLIIKDDVEQYSEYI